MKLQVLFMFDIFLQYKDVVHFMPSKCLQAENLIDIVKRDMISLEEIGFQILLIITDNNAIDLKKNSIFLLTSSKAFNTISKSYYEV